MWDQSSVPSRSSREWIRSIGNFWRMEDTGAAVIWLAILVIALARLAEFAGLHHGNTDDITVDYDYMTLGLRQMAYSYASHQGRLHFLLAIPINAGMMRLAGTFWYDLLNLGCFALGTMLPVVAFRRYVGAASLQLYALVYFATLPLLFPYISPFAAPMAYWLLVACSIAILLFQRAYDADSGEWSRWRLALGSLFVLLAIFGYEVTAITSLCLLTSYFVTSHAGRPWRALGGRRDVQCAAGVLLVYAVAYVVFRVLHPPEYSGVKVAANLSLSSMAKVIFRLSTSSSIFAWMFWEQPLRYADFGTGFQRGQQFSATFSVSRFALAPTMSIGIACLTAALTLYLLLKAREEKLLRRIALVAGVAGALLFAPNVIYGVTPKISNLVLQNTLYVYVGTSYSHIGFALLVASLGGLVLHALPRRAAAIVAAGAALSIGWGSLSASIFNEGEALSARRQSSKWQVLEYLSACSNRMPQAYLATILAPRMWNYSTGTMSWGDPEQTARYWDLLAQTRYGLTTHFSKEMSPTTAPVTFLDYRLDRNGNLDAVVLGRSQDGNQVQDALLIRQAYGDDLSVIDETSDTRNLRPPQNTALCGHGLELVRFTGTDLNLGTVNVVGLPFWSPLHERLGSDSAVSQNVKSGPASAPAVALPAPPQKPAWGNTQLAPNKGKGNEALFRFSIQLPPPQFTGSPIVIVGALINSKIDGGSACYIFRNLTSNDNRLMADSGSDGQSLGSAPSLGNSQCEVLRDGTDASVEGSTLHWSIHVRFRQAFRGPKMIYLIEQDAAGAYSDFKLMGQWTVE